MRRVIIRFKSGEEEDFLKDDEALGTVETRDNPRLLIFRSPKEKWIRVYNLDSVESYLVEDAIEKVPEVPA